MPSLPSPTSSLLSRLDPALLLIVALGAAVRFWGLGFGLPQTGCRPDEWLVVHPAFAYFSGDLNPHFFRYGSLFSYLCFLGDSLYYLAGSVSGRFEGFDDFVREYQVDPSRFYLIARGLSASFGTATLVIVYRIGLRLFDRPVGLASAFFLAFAHLHVRDSHFGLTDVPHGFFLACGTLWIVRCGQDALLRSYLFAGLFSGLAATTKYAGVMLVAPFCAVHALGARAAGKRLVEYFDRRVFVYFGALALAFLAGTPFALLAPGEFWSHFSSEADHLWTGHAVSLGRGWWWHLSFSLYYGMGWSLLLLALAGALLVLVRWPRKAAALLGFPLVYYAVAGSGETVFVRYAIPLLPFLCIAAAVVAILAARPVVRRFGSTIQSVVAFAICALAITPSLQRVVATNRLLTREDNRLVARSWILANLPPGSTICQTFGYARVQLPHERPLQAPDVPIGEEQREPPPWTLPTEPFQAADLPHFFECLYSMNRRKFVLGGVALAELPQYLIVSRSPQFHDRIVPPEFEPLLERSYREIQALLSAHPVPGSGPRPEWYDPSDAFYLPFTRFDGVERPGPDFHIYERK